MMNPRNPYRPTQWVFQSPQQRRRCCGRCGQDYGLAPSGGPAGWHHLLDDGSGKVDTEMDLDHAPRDENDDYDDDHAARDE